MMIRSKMRRIAMMRKEKYTSKDMIFAMNL